MDQSWEFPPFSQNLIIFGQQITPKCPQQSDHLCKVYTGLTWVGEDVHTLVNCFIIILNAPDFFFTQPLALPTLSLSLLQESPETFSKHFIPLPSQFMGTSYSSPSSHRRYEKTLTLCSFQTQWRLTNLCSTPTNLNKTPLSQPHRILFSNLEVKQTIDVRLKKPTPIRAHVAGLLD